jgi:hypothetical protein
MNLHARRRGLVIPTLLSEITMTVVAFHQVTSLKKPCPCLKPFEDHDHVVSEAFPAVPKKAF